MRGCGPMIPGNLLQCVQSGDSSILVMSTLSGARFMLSGQLGAQSAESAKGMAVKADQNNCGNKEEHPFLGH